MESDLAAHLRKCVLFEVVSLAAHAFELALKLVKLCVAKALKVYQTGSGAFNSAQKLVQFQMESLGVAVLSILD